MPLRSPARSPCAHVAAAVGLLLALVIEGKAQPASARFRRLSLEEGLSQSTVMAVLRDRRGFVWVGTEDGLNCYDGYGFAVYKHDPARPHSLSDNYVVAFHEDRRGRLWVGTSDGGLSVRDPATGRFRAFRHDPARSVGCTLTSPYLGGGGLASSHVRQRERRT